MPKIVDHDERRDAFAHAAKDVISKKGIESARLVDVARTAGATTGSLGHYFEDKDDLIDAALEALVADFEARLRVGEGAFIDAALRFMPIDEESRRDARVWTAFITRSLVSKTVAEKVAKYWKLYHSRVARYLRDYEGRGPEEAGVLADTIMAACDGLTVRAASDPEQWPASRVRAQLESILVQLIGPSALTPPESPMDRADR